MATFRFFKMGAAAILDLQHFKFLTVGRLKRVEVRRRAKCGQNRSNRGQSMAIFRFLQRAQCSHCKRCISYSNSVCLSVRLSVTRRYCVKTAACSKVQFAPLDSKMYLVLQKPKNIPQGRPLPLKCWLKVTYPLLKAASFDTFCLVAPQP